MRTRRFLTLACLILAYCILGLMPRLPAAAAESNQRALLEYQQLPLNFQQDAGNAGEGHSFRASGPGYQLSLLPQEALLNLSGGAAIQLRLPGSNPRASVDGLDPLPGRTYYLEGRDPAGWRTATEYARVRYHEIYPGIDLIFYGNRNRLECDFVLAPGADVRQVRLLVEGAQRLTMDGEGNLALTTADGEISLGKPVVYQQSGATRKVVAGAFQVHGAEVSFSLDRYDHSLPLVVDPTLNYAAYVGRSVNDRVNGIAVGADGSTYVAGESPAVTASSHDEAFVAHISADGKTMLYMTYLGGTGATTGRGIALDKAGNAYITGETKAPDFPVLNALQPSCGKNASGQCVGDAFLAKLNADGSLNYATYLGGGGEDAGHAIAVDSSGDVYVAGATDSIDFPTVHAAQPAPGGHGDAFVAKFSNDGLRLIYSTFIGGSGQDEALGIALDSNLNAYVTGRTQSFDFPVKNAFQEKDRLNNSNEYAQEAFVAKLSAEGDQLLWSTYLGGSGGDSGKAIAVDSFGSAYVSGSTSSDDFPLADPMQAQRRGKTDAFVTKFSPDGASLVYSTFLGGTSDDLATGIAVDKQGTAYISGHTSSVDFPTQAAIQAACRKDGKGECQDAFLAVLNSKGTALQFSSFLGGTGADQGYGIAIDAKGSAYLGGATTSSDFPKAKPAVPEAATERHLGLSSTASSAASQTAGGVVAMIAGLKDDGQASCSGSINWTGGAGNNLWNTAGNWDTDMLPGPSDSVCIGTAFVSATITVATTPVVISSLVSNANISLTTNFTVTGTANFVNALAMSNAILAGAGAETIGGLLTLGGNSSLCAVVACNVTSTAVTNANGGISYTGGGNVYLYGRTLNNAGTATWGTASGYNFYLGYGAIVNNNSGGTWNYTNDYPTLNITTGGGTFNNAGTFEKTAGTNPTTVAPAFTNTGKVLGNSGTVSFTDLAGTSSGSWSAASGDALALDTGTTAASISGNLTGAGTVNFSSGTIDIVAGASFTGTGALDINGGTVVFETGSTVTISQAVTLASNGVLAGTDTVILTGLLTWSGNSSMCAVPACNANGAGVTNANGGISYTGGGNVYLYGRTLNNTGTATWGTASGYNFYLGYGAIVNNKAAGTWNYTNDYPTLNVTTGGGTFNNVGTFEKTAGTNVTTVAPAFTNTGKVLGNSGTVSFTDLLGTSSGSWSAASGDALVLDTGTTPASISGNITGAGTEYFSSGTIDIIAGATFTGSGGLDINGGTVFFETGSTVTISQAVTLATNGVLAGTDTVTMTGLLSWGGNSSMCTVAACNASGAGVTNANGGISYTGGGNVYLYGRTLNNTGTATWGTASGYNFYLGYGAIVNNKAAGTWNYTNDYPTLNVTTGGGTFNNVGTFEKTAGTGTTTVAAAFTNTGKVLGNSGTVSFTDLAGTSSGSWSAASGDALALGTGTTAASISGNISGSGTVNFASGTIDIVAGATFTGTGALNIVGGTVFFETGSPVTMSQAVTLGSGGVLAGTDTVTMTGLLTWNGNSSMCTVAACNASGAGVTNANGGISYGGGGNVYLYGRTLNNAATATWGTSSGYNFYLGYGAVVNNKASATWNYTNDFPALNFTTGGGTFNNAGTFEKTAGTNSTTVSAAFTNTGKVLGNSGTVSFTDLAGTSSGSWSAAGGDTLVLDTGTTAASISGNISGAGTMTFSSGTIDIVAGATFTGTGALDINSIVVFDTGSTVTISQAVTLSSGGVLAGTDTVTITGLLTWNGNSSMCTVTACNASGAGVTNANGGISYTGGGNVNLYGRTLNNAGTAIWGTASGYNFYLGYGAIVNNKASGTWNYTNDYPTLSVTTGGGTFNNAGTFEKTAGTNSTTVSTAFTNTGKVLGNSGTLGFSDLAGTSTGSWSAASGDALALDTGTTPASISGNITGAGTVNFSSGTIDIVAGATFTGTGALNIIGGVVVFETGKSVVIAQAVALSSNGKLAGTDNVTITGLLSWGSGGYMCTVPACNAGGTGVTTATGGINYTGGGNVYLYGRTLNNTGTATWGTASGYNLYLGYAAVINNTAKGIWDYTNDYPTMSLTTGDGKFNNSGVFKKTAGTSTTIVHPLFTNTGAVLGESGTVRFGYLTGTSAGSWSASAGAALELNGGSPTPSLSGNISGAGTVSFSHGTVNIIAGATFTETGTLAINGGAVDFETGSTVTIPGTVHLSASGILAGTDTVTITGLLTWGDSARMCTVVACNAGGTGATTANGGIYYTAGGNVYLYGRTLNNAGTATWGTTSGYNLYLGYAAVINNTSKGIWNYTNTYPTMSLATGGGSFNNAGVFEKTAGTAATTINPAFVQTGGTTYLGSGSLAFGSTPMIQGGSVTGAGTISSNISTSPAGIIAPGTTTVAGTLALTGASGSGNYTQSTGAFDVKLGGTLAGQFDTLTASGTATLAGTLKVTLIGGFTPVAGNAFTILTAGTVTGKFVSTTFPSLTSGLSWQVTYNPTTVVLSVVSGGGVE